MEIAAVVVKAREHLALSANNHKATGKQQKAKTGKLANWQAAMV